MEVKRVSKGALLSPTLFLNTDFKLEVNADAAFVDMEAA